MALVLAENLQLLRSLDGNPSTQQAIAERAGIDQTTVGRILRGVNATTVDKLVGLADAFGVQPHQLLIPGFDPRVSTEQTTMTPMALEVARLYMELPPDRRAALHAVAEAMHNPMSQQTAQRAASAPAGSPTPRRTHHW